MVFSVLASPAQIQNFKILIRPVEDFFFTKKCAESAFNAFLEAPKPLNLPKKQPARKVLPLTGTTSTMRPHGAAGSGATSVLAKRARSARNRAIPQRARSAREGLRAFDRKCGQSSMPGQKRGKRPQKAKIGPPI